MIQSYRFSLKTTTDNNDKEMYIIEGHHDNELPHIEDRDLSENILPLLPPDFKFRTLTLSHISVIHALLMNHYIEDEYGILRLVYSKKFLYWYLKNVPSELLIGLSYKDKLVGFITCIVSKYFINDKEVTLPFGNLLCLQQNLRGLGMAKYLIEELRTRLVKMKLEKYMFTSATELTTPFAILSAYSIPLNQTHLRNVDFLQEDFPHPPKIKNNPLRMMCIDDAEQIATTLTTECSKYVVRPVFTKQYVIDFMKPYKDIIYSYVIKNADNIVTDFVSVMKTYYYCMEKKEIVQLANLTFYFNKSIALRDLICCLIDKIKRHGFDQFNFYNIMDNDDIHLSKFETSCPLHVYIYNLQMQSVQNKNICMMIV